MDARPEKLQQAVPFMGIGQVGDITLALMVSSSIIFNRATANIRSTLPATTRTTIQHAILEYGSSLSAGLGGSERRPVLSAIVESINDLFVLFFTANALSLVMSLFMKPESIFGAGSSSN